MIQLPDRGRFRKKARPVRRMHVRYRAPGLEAIGAETRNIGVDGAFLVTSSPLRAGATVDLLLDAPDGTTLELPAEVRWVAAVDTIDHEAGMGVQFGPLGPERRAKLEACFAALPPRPDEDDEY